MVTGSRVAYVELVGTTIGMNVGAQQSLDVVLTVFLKSEGRNRGFACEVSDKSREPANQIGLGRYRDHVVTLELEADEVSNCLVG